MSLNNQESKKQYNKKYYIDNRERVRERQREYYRKNRDKIRERHKVYYSLFKDKILKQHKERLRTNDEARLIQNLRNRLRAFMRGKSKSDSSMEILGCSQEHLKAHLEFQFAKGMTWDNYGKEWHIDHRIPISAFDANNPAEVRTCFHFSNLQPMWAKENKSKGGKICLES